MDHEAIQRKFSAALGALVDQVKEDRSILAAILCGSLAHDTVWAKSDIDLVLVTVDDRTDRSGHADSDTRRLDRALHADGVNIHAFLLPRSEFRKAVGSSVHHSFLHSLLAKGRLLYTHDPTIADLCATLAEIGARDTQWQLLRAATHALPPLYKARKWFVTRGDLEYTALWILYAATPLAQIEVIGRGLLVDREVIPQASSLNPSLFRTIYTDLLNTKKTTKNVRAALEAVERYLADRTPTLLAPIIEYLREIGEARSCTEIETHFHRNFGVNGVTTACEYLADQGLIGKASTTVRLTKRSNVDVQELAFFYLAKGTNK